MIKSLFYKAFKLLLIFIDGTRGRTRTGTLLRARDFESRVSTNFTTLAQGGDYSSGPVSVNSHGALC